MNTHLLEWPPAYRIKKHKRARSVKLRITRFHGLEITLPYRFNLRNLASILEENKDWIIKQIAKIPVTDILPDKIIFTAIAKEIAVQYVNCQIKLEMIERPTDEIILIGKIDDKNLCKKILLNWIRKQAKIHLINQLKLVSQQVQLSYESVMVRDQKTLWGSCTNQKNISLSYKLIFLPHHLMRHIMIHELCHTQHLNHSTKFWQLVSAFDPNWQQHKYAMRHAEQFIPAWL